MSNNLVKENAQPEPDSSALCLAEILHPVSDSTHEERVHYVLETLNQKLADAVKSPFEIQCLYRFLSENDPEAANQIFNQYRRILGHQLYEARPLTSQHERKFGPRIFRLWGITHWELLSTYNPSDWSSKLLEHVASIAANGLSLNETRERLEAVISARVTDRKGKRGKSKDAVLQACDAEEVVRSLQKVPNRPRRRGRKQKKPNIPPNAAAQALTPPLSEQPLVVFPEKEHSDSSETPSKSSIELGRAFRDYDENLSPTHCPCSSAPSETIEGGRTFRDYDENQSPAHYPSSPSEALTPHTEDPHIESIFSSPDPHTDCEPLFVPDHTWSGEPGNQERRTGEQLFRLEWHQSNLPREYNTDIGTPGPCDQEYPDPMSEDSQSADQRDPLTIDLFHTLLPGQQLTTGVIVRALQTFLASSTVHIEAGLEIQKAQPWTNSGSFDIDYSSIEHILLPLDHSHPSPHWTLGHIEIPSFTITWYNSQPGVKYRVDAEKALIKTAKEMQHLRRSSIEETQLQMRVGMCPDQGNRFDCGVHVIMNAFRITHGLKLPSSSKQTGFISPVLWRWAIAYGLLPSVPNYSVHELDEAVASWVRSGCEGANSPVNEVEALVRTLDTCYAAIESGWKVYLADNVGETFNFEMKQTYEKLLSDRKFLTTASKDLNNASECCAASKKAIRENLQSITDALRGWKRVAAAKANAAALGPAYEGLSKIGKMVTSHRMSDVAGAADKA